MSTAALRRRVLITLLATLCGVVAACTSTADTVIPSTSASSALSTSSSGTAAVPSVTPPWASSSSPLSAAITSPAGTRASYRTSACPDPLIPGVSDARLDGFVCGSLTVPLDRSVNGGPTIDLQVAIAKALSPHPRSDPIIYLVGGPGGPAMLIGPALVAEGWNSDRDVIVLNQRGTTFATPSAVCPALDAYSAAAISSPLTEPAVAKQRVAAVAACHQKLAGQDLAAYDTVANAQDVGDLRVALGIAEWNVVGSSYGTDLALQVLRLAPEGIRSVVLDSVLPPSVNLVEQRWSAMKSASRAVFAACRVQRPCAVAYPNLQQEFDRLLVDLTIRPRRIQVANPAGGAPATVAIDGYALLTLLTAAASQPNGFASVPAMIHELANGGGQAAAKQLAAGSELPPGFNGYGLLYGVVCREFVPYTSRATVVAAAQRAFPQIPAALAALVPNLGVPFDECSTWDVPPIDKSELIDVSSDVPTLMLSGSFDTQTPPADADRVARNLTRAIHDIIPGAGHVVSLGYPCAHTLIFSFLDRLAEPDDSCLSTATVPPFTVKS